MCILLQCVMVWSENKDMRIRPFRLDSERTSGIDADASVERHVGPVRGCLSTQKTMHFDKVWFQPCFPVHHLNRYHVPSRI